MLLLLPLEVLGDIIFFFFAFGSKTKIEPKKILIIKVDQLGDVLFSTLLLPKIKEKYPEAKIDYLINPKSEAVLKNNPHINQVYFWQSLFLSAVPGRRGRLSLSSTSNMSVFKELQENKYDVVINARAYFPSSNWRWHFLGAKALVAFDFSSQSFLADRLVHYDLAANEEENYLRLLEPLGIESKIEARPEFFNLSDGQIEPDLAVFSPLSFDPEKSWPLAYWPKLLQLLEAKGYRIILSGLKEHASQLEEIKKEAGSLKSEIMIKDIPSLAGAIKRAALFVGIESFPAHLAIALKKKSFCLVNTKLFYVKGLSSQALIDGRSMLPQIEGVIIKDLSAKPEALVELIPKIN